MAITEVDDVFAGLDPTVFPMAAAVFQLTLHKKTHTH